MTLWPWAEANEGLIGSVALIAALSVALWEFVRFRADLERRRRSEAMIVEAAVSEFIDAAGKAYEPWDRPDESGLTGKDRWQNQCSQTAALAQALLSKTNDPHAAALLVNLERVATGPHTTRAGWSRKMMPALQLAMQDLRRDYRANAKLRW